MSIDVHRLAAHASALAGFDVATSRAALALVEADSKALQRKHGKRVRWDVWDKESSINGVEATHILARHDYKDGEIYLIWIDDHLTFLQPHHPGSDAPVQADEVGEVAALHAAEIVENLIFEDLAQVLVGEATPPSRSVSIDDLRDLLEEQSSGTGARGVGRRGRGSP